MPRTISGIPELRSLVGQEVAASSWFTMTQERISRFAETTQDSQWIHVDPERAAAESPYGATIAHGFLTLSMLSDFSRDAVHIEGDFKMRINYGLNKVRFPAAVRAGSRIRGRFALGAVEDVEGGVQVVWNCVVEVEGQAKPAVAAEWLLRIYY
jgi:acyl dehydratase